MTYHGYNKDQFMEECNEEFKDRFTSEDKEFTAYVETPQAPPPVVQVNQNQQPPQNRQGYETRRDEREERRDRSSDRRPLGDRHRDPHHGHSHMGHHGHHHNHHHGHGHIGGRRH